MAHATASPASEQDGSDDEIVLVAPIVQGGAAQAAAPRTTQGGDEDAQAASTKVSDWVGPDGAAGAVPAPPMSATEQGSGGVAQEDVGTSGPSWWDRHFRLEYMHHVTAVHVRLKGLGISEADIDPATHALAGFLAREADPDKPLSLDIDLSDNQISDNGGAILLRWLGALALRHRGGSKVRILKLYKNQLGDGACEQLASLISAQQAPMEEIHLSHNRIAQRGLVALLVAIATHPTGAYPRLASQGGECPCWVRVEYNRIADVRGILESLAGEAVKLRICHAPRSKHSASCTSYYCSSSSRSMAHVHLFCISEQSVPPGAHCEKPAKLVLEYAARARLGWPDLLEGSPAVRVAESRARITAPPRDAVSARLVQLRVDSAKGAGVELEPDAHGFLVAAVDEFPGQDVEEGEVILEIDGVQLWGGLDEDSLGEAFGSRFGDGARLQVARAEALRGRAVWRSLGIAPEILQSSCPALRDELRQDLSILGRRCGVAADLLEGDAAVVLRGWPGGQRLASEELGAMLAFYFPCAAPAASGSSVARLAWFGEPDRRYMPAVRAALPADDGGQGGEVGDGGQGEAAFDGGQGERVCDGGQGELDIGDWETSLRQQWAEDDDLDDEDLPCEPLEAPDDGPDMFEGEFTAPQYCLDRPLQMLLLMGLPGSGKSTLAARLQAAGWAVINQDTLGDRRTCVSHARRALLAGEPVVIDRCNISRMQRSVWTSLADGQQVGVGCVWLDIHPAECGKRVMQRFNHPTLPATSSSLRVVEDFCQRLETPMEAEGFVLWRAQSPSDVEAILYDVQQLVGQRDANAWHEDQAREAPGAAKAEQIGFTYQEARGRSWRVQHLRAVRRQIEYYFSDCNLVRDWFFQEKIAGEPEPGWLELRWILTCPRIRSVYKASLDDVLEALGPSSLIVKQAGGTHWVRRGRPLPALVEARPANGEEPEWYRELHSAHGDAG